MAKSIVISLLIIAIGMAWLLNVLHVIAGVDWLWTIALAATGVLTLLWGKLNKFTFIMGLFLVVSSVFSVLRQTSLLSLEIEVPLLVIVFGLLFLLAQMPVIPLPEALMQMKREAQRQKSSP